MMEYDEALLMMEPYYNKIAAMQSTQEIRDFLAAEQIVGKPRSTTGCVIAEYVEQGSGVPTSVGNWVLPSRVCIPSITDNYPPTTRVMQEFMCNFDAGDYPELVAK
jgi:hypothetical protein